MSHIQEEREEGFSLVELLVVIVIIGILSAIAVGAFLNQRKKANDAAVESELRKTVTTIETLLVDNPNARGVISGIATTEDGEGLEGEIVNDQWRNVTFVVNVTDIENVYKASAKTLGSAKVKFTDGVMINVVDHTVQDGYQVVGFHYDGSKYSPASGKALLYDSAKGTFETAPY